MRFVALRIFSVKDAYSISELASHAPAVMRRAEKKGAVTVCRNGRVVGFLISRERMEAILETLEIMADPKAMQAIRDYEAGKMRFKDISCLDD
jgi:antitoxin YefM